MVLKNKYSKRHEPNETAKYNVRGTQKERRQRVTVRENSETKKKTERDSRRKQRDKDKRRPKE